MKLKGPLLSMEARKTLGNTLEFSRRQGKNLLRFHQQPTGPRSQAQTIERQYYSEAVAAWKSLSLAQKQQWDDYNIS